MAIEMQTEYKGHKIAWCDWNKFSISLDDVALKEKITNLADCEKYIDSRLKAKFKRVEVICKIGWRSGGLRKAEATSIVEDEYVWVTAGKDRSKENIEKVYLYNEKNIGILAELKVIEVERVRLDKKETELFDSFDRLKVEMMTVPNE